MKIHLDTDIGSDTDDACALAMLLGWPGVELTGITTSIDPGGRRAGFVHHCLELAGRTDVPVAAGAEVSMTTLEFPGTIPDDGRYWQRPMTPQPSPPGAALDLLDQSIKRGATVVAIGPYTNLALLEVARPGRLGRTSTVIMGGALSLAGPGMPQYGPDRDWNVQCDTRAAAIVAAAARLTVVPLEAGMQAQLLGRELPALRAAGPLGSILAAQGAAYAEDNDSAGLVRMNAALPDDFLNFQYDGVACAVAAGWDGATKEQRQLTTVIEDGILRFAPDDQGRTTEVVVDIDGEGFRATWLEMVARASPAG